MLSPLCRSIGFGHVRLYAVAQMCGFAGRRVSIDAAIGLACFAALLLVPTVALAHEGEGVAGGFVSGFTLPLFGSDHVIAMIVRSTAGVHA